MLHQWAKPKAWRGLIELGVPKASKGWSTKAGLPDTTLRGIQ